MIAQQALASRHGNNRLTQMDECQPQSLQDNLPPYYTAPPFRFPPLFPQGSILGAPCLGVPGAPCPRCPQSAATSLLALCATQTLGRQRAAAVPALCFQLPSNGPALTQGPPRQAAGPGTAGASPLRLANLPEYFPPVSTVCGNGSAGSAGCPCPIAPDSKSEPCLSGNIGFNLEEINSYNTFCTCPHQIGASRSRTLPKASTACLPPRAPEHGCRALQRFVSQRSPRCCATSFVAGCTYSALRLLENAKAIN